MRPISLRRARAPRGPLGSIRSIASIALFLAASACGGGMGGGGGSHGPTPLTIATTSIPPAGQNVPYSSVFHASGGSGP
jgi:hypothetical protein